MGFCFDDYGRHSLVGFFRRESEAFGLLSDRFNFCLIFLHRTTSDFFLHRTTSDLFFASDNIGLILCIGLHRTLFSLHRTTSDFFLHRTTSDFFFASGSRKKYVLSAQLALSSAVRCCPLPNYNQSVVVRCESRIVRCCPLRIPTSPL